MADRLIFETAVQTAAGLRPVRARRAAATLLVGLGIYLLGTTLGASSAAADLKLCNTTPSRIGVVIGYKDKKGWVTEGWWNVPPNVCWTLIKGDLIARYYYVHAIDYDRPGVWDRNENGPSSEREFYMCTADKAFEIRGANNCEERGYHRTRFFEVDTKDQTSWTITLQDKPEQRANKQ